MLVFEQKVGEQIIIDHRIILEVTKIEGGRVKLGITAPKEVPVRRQEVKPNLQGKGDNQCQR